MKSYELLLFEEHEKWVKKWQKFFEEEIKRQFNIDIEFKNETYM